MVIHLRVYIKSELGYWSVGYVENKLVNLGAWSWITFSWNISQHKHPLHSTFQGC